VLERPRGGAEGSAAELLFARAEARRVALQAFFNLINTSPFGAELAGAFNALPNFPDPLSFGTANFSGGTYNRGPALNGSAQFLTFSARVFSYTPCFFSVRAALPCVAGHAGTHACAAEAATRVP